MALERAKWLSSHRLFGEVPWYVWPFLENQGRDRICRARSPTIGSRHFGRVATFEKGQRRNERFFCNNQLVERASRFFNQQVKMGGRL
jgi:hypothetical protein